jgi:hypothetical protein
MLRTTIVITAALAVTLPALPAQAAGVNRTFLSAAGSDSNNCANVLTPCRHLATAYAATAANGEIYVLDPANYGSVAITGPVSIEGHGWASIAPPSGGNAITINANPGDAINIIGVVLDGTALANTNGIVFTSGGSLTIRDSVIRNFGGDGIDFLSSASISSELSLRGVVVADNGGYGIKVQPTGAAAVTAFFDNVDASDNVLDGLILVGGFSTGSITATASGTAAAGNSGSGFDVDAGATSTTLLLYHCVAANNLASGLVVFGTGAALRAAGGAVTGNIQHGWNVTAGVLDTYGDNYIIGNGSNVGSATTTPKL